MRNIKGKKRLFNKYLKLNKMIVDDQAIAPVPALSSAKQTISALA
ncbi:MAG TPA: hypothetical protein VGI04_00500 [Neobacillus sp.]|jgi:hypothetical protein